VDIKEEFIMLVLVINPNEKPCLEDIPEALRHCSQRLKMLKHMNQALNSFGNKRNLAILMIIRYIIFYY